MKQENGHAPDWHKWRISDKHYYIRLSQKIDLFIRCKFIKIREKYHPQSFIFQKKTVFFRNINEKNEVMRLGLYDN